MSLDYKTSLITLFQQRFPGRFSCRTTRSGKVTGLRIDCSERSGYAFLYEPAADGQMLLALHETEDDDNPEVWVTTTFGEVLERVRPWAFPASWSQPAPVDGDLERKRLRRLRLALSFRDMNSCRIEKMDATLANLITATGLRMLAKDLESLDPVRLVRNFPFDDAGRISLKTTVLLRVYAAESSTLGERNVCLVATGPERRSDLVVVRVHLAPLIVANQSHRWERNEWLWQAMPPPAKFLLGANSDLIGRHSTARPETKSGLESSGSDLQEAGAQDRARSSLKLLDGGMIEEAFALYGITFSGSLHCLIGGQRIPPPACCAHVNGEWTELLLARLRSAAPWLLSDAIAAEIDRLGELRSARKRTPAPKLKLFIFPGQKHARKACLFLTADKDGANLRFEIQLTASNARLHDTAWKRPLEVDFRRYHV